MKEVLLLFLKVGGVSNFGNFLKCFKWDVEYEGRVRRVLCRM